MFSGQNYPRRLQEQAHRTLAPHVSGIAETLSTLQKELAASLASVDEKLQLLETLQFAHESDILVEAVEELKRQQGQALHSVARFAVELRRKETQEEILNLLLDETHALARQAVLFVMRGDQLIVWGSRGFAEEQAQNIAKVSIRQSDSRLLQDALGFSGLCKIADFGAEQALIQLLQPDPSNVWFGCPLRAVQRPVALLLLSVPAEEESNAEIVSIITELTGLCVENIALKIMKEMSAVRPSTPPVEQEQGSRTAATSSGGENQAAEAAHEVVAQAGAANSAAVDSTSDEAAWAVAEAAAEEGTAESAVIDSGVPLPAEPEVLGFDPEALKTAQQNAQPVSEEERLHSDAKRFARLLVSEIKLYNEQRVLEGRENRDIYVRLKRDIDRSREMYEKRVAPTVSRRIDYFNDELIRILGENDPSTLGSDYPGARVET